MLVRKDFKFNVEPIALKLSGQDGVFRLQQDLVRLQVFAVASVAEKSLESKVPREGSLKMEPI